MSNLHEILQTESGNTDKIHFYREGVFYKAYERSAYAFVTRVKAFMVKRLHSYFASDKITETDSVFR